MHRPQIASTAATSSLAFATALLAWPAASWTGPAESQSHSKAVVGDLEISPLPTSCWAEHQTRREQAKLAILVPVLTPFEDLSTQPPTEMEQHPRPPHYGTA